MQPKQWSKLGNNASNGMYSYSDLNSYIHKYMDQQNHKTGKKYHINLSFALSTYKIVIEIDSNYQLDLRDSEFGDFKIGLDEKILNKTEYKVLYNTGLCIFKKTLTAL